MIVEGYTFSVINTLSEFMNEFSGPVSLFSLYTSILWCLVFLSFSFPTVLLIVYRSYKGSREKIKKSSFKVLFEGFKPGSLLASSYYTMFTIRRIIIAVVVVFCTQVSNFGQKMAVYVFSQAIAVIYLIAIRPYTDWKMNISETIQELVFVLVITFHILWTTEEAWTDTRVLVVLNILMVNGIISLSFC